MPLRSCSSGEASDLNLPLRTPWLSQVVATPGGLSPPRWVHRPVLLPCPMTRFLAFGANYFTEKTGSANHLVTRIAALVAA